MAQEKNGEKNWYVVNTYSGHENKVKDNLLARKDSMDMQDFILNVLVAEETVPVIDKETGKQKMVKNKETKELEPKFKQVNFYPGYVFVEMVMTDDAWFVVRNTPDVTGFIGSSGKGAKPFPVPKEEMDTVLKKAGQINQDMYTEYVVGTDITVLKGPLASSSGKIESVDATNGRVIASVTFFGRTQQVELDFQDIEKA
ncbi:MAG: transcription termination/antitermination protein NusG [Bacilli bacterium]